MKRYVATAGILLLTLVSGCLYELRDEFTECKINCATHMSALAAWGNMRSCCQGMSCPHSFKEGFMTGYKAVADGGTGCPPAIPIIRIHNHMWLDRCCESDKMEAWYDGYEVGVVAAKADGMEDANRISSRMPQSTPVDFSNSGRALLNEPNAVTPTESFVPPPPYSEPTELSDPQTSYSRKKAFE